MDRVTLCDAGRGASPSKCWKGEIMKIVVPPNEDFGKAVAVAASTHDSISTDINRGEAFIEVLKDEILRVTGFPCDPRRGYRDDVYYLL